MHKAKKTPSLLLFRENICTPEQIGILVTQSWKGCSCAYLPTGLMEHMCVWMNNYYGLKDIHEKCYCHIFLISGCVPMRQPVQGVNPTSGPVSAGTAPVNYQTTSICHSGKAAPPPLGEKSVGHTVSGSPYWTSVQLVPIPVPLMSSQLESRLNRRVKKEAPPAHEPFHSFPPDCFSSGGDRWIKSTMPEPKNHVRSHSSSMWTELISS